MKLRNCLDKLIWYCLRKVSFSSNEKFVCGSKNSKPFSENENSASRSQFFKILALWKQNTSFLRFALSFFNFRNYKCKCISVSRNLAVISSSHFFFHFYASYREFIDYPCVNTYVQTYFRSTLKFGDILETFFPFLKYYDTTNS